MNREGYLLDKSAFARWPKPTVAPLLDDLSDRGLRADHEATDRLGGPRGHRRLIKLDAQPYRLEQVIAA